MAKEDMVNDSDMDQDFEDIHNEEDLNEGDEQDHDDPIVAKAIEQGWRPEDEWDGDPADWVDAKEFVYRGQLMERISKESKTRKRIESELTEVKQALKALSDHNKKIAQLEYQRALKQLKKEKALALEEGDHEAVIEIDDRIDDLKDSQDEFDTQEDDTTSTKQGQYSPEDVAKLQSWIGKNPWFNTDIVMQGAVDALANRYLSDNPDDVEGMLHFVDKEIRKEFPHKFKKKPSGSAVTETTGRGVAKKKTKGKQYSTKDLSDEQLTVAKQFVKLGTFENVQEYVDQLAELGELPAQQGE